MTDTTRSFIRIRPEMVSTAVEAGRRAGPFAAVAGAAFGIFIWGVMPGVHWYLVLGLAVPPLIIAALRTSAAVLQQHHRQAQVTRLSVLVTAGIGVASSLLALLLGGLAVVVVLSLLPPLETAIANTIGIVVQASVGAGAAWLLGRAVGQRIWPMFARTRIAPPEDPRDEAARIRYNATVMGH